jgi:hypothetical protein
LPGRRHRNRMFRICLDQLDQLLQLHLDTATDTLGVTGRSPLGLVRTVRPIFWRIFAMQRSKLASVTMVVLQPVNVIIRGFVRLIELGDYLAAAAKIREENVLPAITGREMLFSHRRGTRCVPSAQQSSREHSSASSFRARFFRVKVSGVFRHQPLDPAPRNRWPRPSGTAIAIASTP